MVSGRRLEMGPQLMLSRILGFLCLALLNQLQSLLKDSAKVLVVGGSKWVSRWGAVNVVAAVRFGDLRRNGREELRLGFLSVSIDKLDYRLCCPR
ncbi:hypothetical protein TorRG33x02_096100 [Trema orientale]|uniref:Secreted protein n=1 Tax=Trema orientale TaxID=63057 RepID=A0A2P5F9W4_TREOI|nr:hypothetical protein TorRG33x02_096100 [Trema orientale]